jgi:signal transduction histidine kinase
MAARSSAAPADLPPDLAHELRNPLAAVKGLIELIRRGDHDARTQGRLDVVLAEVLRMEDMLRPPRSVPAAPVGDVIGDVVAVVEASALAAGVTVSRTGAAAITGDPRLKAALLNLVGNAIEATPPGGRVDIATADLGDAIAIEIADTGRGLTPDDLARLGTPFFSRRNGGTGLGVMLARATITQHGGSLTYRSTPGMGTTARVVLSRHQGLGGRGERPPT